MPDRLSAEFFSQHPLVCAEGLIGSELFCGKASGIVVETEAYAAVGDEASHTFFRKKAREFVGQNIAGTAYVYLNYGRYWLTNVLIKGETDGFVLIRALEPSRGIDLMRKRRQREKLTDLCSGPGKLSIALGIDGAHHGLTFVETDSPFFFEARERAPELVRDRRVGISKAVDLPWRFLRKGCQFVSVKAAN